MSFLCGPFKSGQRVRAKEGHPCRPMGEGIVFQKEGATQVGVFYPNSPGPSPNSPRLIVPFDIKDLEPAETQVPQVPLDA